MSSVVDAIRSVAGNDPHVLAAMLMGSSLESNQNPSAVGDHGKSFGIFQIYTVAHPNVTAAQASDPAWAARFMLPAYQAGVAKVSPSLWQSNPALASAQAAYYAERPAKMYTGYDAKWSLVQAQLNGADISGPVTGGVGGTAGGGGGSSLLSDPLGVGSAVSTVTTSFTHGLMTFANMLVFFSAGMLGATIFVVGIGFIFLSTDTGQKITRTAVGVAGNVASVVPGGSAVGAVIRSKGVANKTSAASKKVVERRETPSSSSSSSSSKVTAPDTKVEGVRFNKAPEGQGNG